MQHTQQQIVLPLLNAMDDNGGRSRTADLYDAVATKCGISEEAREATVRVGRQNVNVYKRSVRWAQQRARLQNLITPIGTGEWELTGKGKDALRRAAPGIVITIFCTDMGTALFGNSEEAIGYLDDGSIQSIICSPPYPLLREKQYGNKHVNEYLDWLLRIAEQWPKKLTADGSVVINLGDVWTAGEPYMSLYQERLLIRLEDELGWKLCQRYAWHNPAKMPAPAEWVTIRRVRVKPSLEQIYWLAPNGEPYADNRNVLVPYSEAMRSRIAAGGETGGTRPSGHHLAAGAFDVDNGGAIPTSLLVASNTSSNSDYIRKCREQGLPVHPARFPADLPRHFVALTTREGDTVLDPFGGSLETGAVAEEMGRHWIGIDCTLEYLYGGANRFPNARMTRSSIDSYRPAGDLFSA
ncbi:MULTISPECIES: site-specific DNA-methyltransferase [Caballeronia]|uniref:site-specific DNA-methyltransferase n=1 Tax=Caballeronia TaxID=1827195 RepID=UPI001FD585D9|nr:MULTISPECIES: site-specific DNA-methyltransferase [Caballeronia]MDR5798993.1 site-specific DNA-methyltransferase [Caballeronia sp. LZ001]